MRLEALEQRRLLAVFGVNSVLDTVDANVGDGLAEDASGNTTLRAAIMEANASSGADTINLPAGTYNLTLAGFGEDAAATGDLDLLFDVTIIGDGADTTIIDGQSQDRLFDLFDFADLEVQNVTLTNGQADNSGVYTQEAQGGAIRTYYYNTLAFSGCVFANNSAPSATTSSRYGLGGAIYSYGRSLTIENCQFVDNLASNSGGAVYLDGPATVSGSTFSGNTTDLGGGAITARQPITVETSTFFGNTSEGPGGAFEVTAQGELTLTNSTVSGNTGTYGGGIHSYGSLTLTSSTIADNTADWYGGGVYVSSGSTASFENMLVADNTATSTGPDVDGAVTSAGYNLIGDSSDSTGFGSTGDQLDVAPLLGSLNNNGGATLTHALLTGSPAIDAANTATSPTTDQRGVARPYGDEADIGAYEWQPGGQISGTKFNDADGDGVFDAEEVGIPDWTIYLDENGNGQYDEGGSSSASHSSTDVPVTIDGTAVHTSTLTIPDGVGTIADANVTLDITHTYDWDLVVDLIAPDNTTVNLFSNVGGSGANFTGTILDDEAGTLISAGSAPFTGSYQPAGSLSTFDGLDAAGTWTLQITDTYPGYDDGTLNSWSLELSVLGAGEPLTLTDSNGEYAFTDLQAGTYTVAEVQQLGWLQTAPASGTHTVTLTAGEEVSSLDFGNMQQETVTTTLSPSADGYATDEDQDGTFTALDTTSTYIWTSYFPSGVFASPSEERGLLEFDLSSFSSSSTVISATLELIPIQLTGGVYPTVHLYAYEGDGTVTLADATIGGVEQDSVTIETFDTVSFSLDPTYVQDLLGTDTELGLMTRQLVGNGSFVQFTSSEYGSTSYRPRLVLETIELGEIRGSKWEDADADGVWDAEESALPDWEIYLDLNENGQYDSGEPLETTDASGEYAFTQLAAGTYIVAEIQQSGWTQIYPAVGSSSSTASPTSTNEGLEDLVTYQIINSPSTPPTTVEYQQAMVDVDSMSAADVLLTEVPTSTWTYGCTATSAGMIFGYYDRIGYSDMYTGSTNGGVAPLTDLGQGDDPANPIAGSTSLIATMDGFDGRTTAGHVDDYWISQNSSGPDPWESGGTEHTWGDCTADYLGTNQWKWDYDGDSIVDTNIDGATAVWSNPSADKLYDYTPSASYGTPQTAACHGMRLFAESRGYTVLENYTQKIDTLYTGGFSFSDYMTEIDAGCPVMIHVVGHTMVGVGYEVATSTVYLHDTWDNSVHTMTWGGSYSGMAMQSVTIIHLEELNTVSDGTHVVELETGEVVTGIDFGNHQDSMAEIQGVKWNDLDGDGVQDAEEPGLAGWEIYIDSNSNDQWDDGEPIATTDADGLYTLSGLEPGTYTVAEVQQTGWTQIFPVSPGTHSVVLTEGQVIDGIDFGNQALPGEIHGSKWNDLDGDGTWDTGEPVLAGWEIYLDANENEQWDTGEPITTTAADGTYSFTDLTPGTYTVREVSQTDWEQTSPGDVETVNTFVSIDNDPEGDSPRALAYTLDGQYVLVVNRDTDNVTVLNAATRALVATVPVGDNPRSIAVSSTYAVVANLNSDNVSVIDLSSWTVTATVPVTGTEPYRVQVSDDGTTAIVGVSNNPGGGTPSSFSVIDLTGTPTEIRTFDTTPQGVISLWGTTETRDYGYEYSQFVLSSDNQTLVLADRDNSQIMVYDWTTGSELAALASEDSPTAVDISDDGTLAVVSHELSSTNDVSVVDLSGTSPTITASYDITTDSISNHVVRITPDKSHAVVSTYNDVFFVDLSTGGTTATFYAATIFDMAITYDDSYLLVAGYEPEVVDLSSFTVVKTFYGLFSHVAAASPTDYRVVCVDAHAAETVHFFDANGASGSLEGSVPTGGVPEGDAPRYLAVSADGSIAITGNTTSQNVSIIDLATQTVRAYVDTGDRVQSVAITPDGSTAVVANMESNTVSIIDLSTDTLVKTLSTYYRPSEIVISPDSQWAYVTSVAGTDLVYFIELDGVSSSISGTLTAGNYGSFTAYDFTMSSGLALSADGSILAACSSFTDELILIDTATQSEIVAVSIGSGTYPIQAAFSPDGTKAYVLNYGTDTVSVVSVDGTSSAVVATISGMDEPATVNVDAAGAFVYVGNNGSTTPGVQVIDTSTNTVVQSISLPNGGAPRSAYLSDTNSILYLTGPRTSGTGSVYRVDAQGASSSVIDEVILDGAVMSLGFSESLNTAVVTEPLADGVAVVAYSNFVAYGHVIEVGPGEVVEDVDFGNHTEATNEPPTVELTNTTTSLSEDTDTTSRTKVADIVVTDDGIGTNVLSLTGDDAALFEIDGTELYLVAGATLDFETNPVLDITVEVDDTSLGTGAEDSDALAITITDVNEAPTVELTGTTTSLPEDTDTTARLKVADIVVTDDALGTNVLSLTGDDAALFEIDGTELYLVAGTTLDFETDPDLHVTVEVDDASLGTGAEDSDALAITVTDVEELDFGDAPDPTYPTLLASDGARHVATGPMLGTARDTEWNGQPTPGADGDDSNGTADEDGIVGASSFAPGMADAWVEVVVSADSYVNAWIDFNADGTWDASEQLATDLMLTAGTNHVTFAIPATAVPGITYARLRLTSYDTGGTLLPTGLAQDGEVEDYIVQIDDELYLYGTEDDDTVVVRTDGSDYTVTINGVSNVYSMATYSSIVLDGAGGTDSLEIYDWTGNDTFAVDPSQATMDWDSDGVDFTGLGFETVKGVALYGGTDEATLTGTTGADKFYGKATQAYIYDAAGTDYRYTASAFETTTGVSGGGGDTAYLYGSTGDDTLDVTVGAATMTRAGSTTSVATDFANVNGYGVAGGTDVATVTGTTGTDLFTAKETYAYMRNVGGSDYLLYVTSFGEVTGYGDADDTAYLYGAATDDTLEMNVASATMTRSGSTTSAASGFGAVNGYAGAGGTDTATMTGSTGTDLFSATEDYGYIRNVGGTTDYFLYAASFSEVTANGNGGVDDVAYLYGSSSDDSLELSPSSSSMIRSGLSTSVANDFANAYGYAGAGGTDTVTLTGTSGEDRFYGRETLAYMRNVGGSDYFLYARDFGEMTANAGGGSDDVAYLWGSTGDDTLDMAAALSTMTRSGSTTTAVGDFATVYGLATTGGTDTANLVGTTGDDVFYSRPAYSILRDAASAVYQLYAGGFSTVEAHGNGGADDIAYLYGSTGSDTLDLTVGSSTMTRAGSSTAVATDFANVNGYAVAGGTDTATLTGTTGADLFSGKETVAYMRDEAGAAYSLYADKFSEVTAYGGGGDDTAYLYGSVGSDTLTMSVGFSTMTRAGSTSTVANNFATVKGYAVEGGTDTATLTGTTGADTFTGQDDWGILKDSAGTSYFNYIRYFDEVYAEAGDTTSGNDTLDVSETAGVWDVDYLFDPGDLLDW